MKKIMIPVCFASFLAFGTACNSNKGGENTTDSTTTTSTTGSTTMTDTGTNTTANAATADTSMANDSKFVLDAASGGLMEVELGKIAATNAASAKVKEFGRMMVTDHSKANTQLKAVAAKKNITIPATPAEEQQKHIDDLKTKKGADFDKAYVDMMVDDHKEDISKFEDESKNGKDADVKAFASKTLPVLNKHLSSIQSIQQGMKK
ncbi:DUF4142 domain-containing protein [Segetibacter koreensis]|uniref:DUF4142 domain-containing protein n=1 Tax=Segetibacter koreensis TaxID=398037 RepID=UPI0003A5DBC3|nr:DUF4142 domain-containing protein [Segetibacter koreensis]